MKRQAQKTYSRTPFDGKLTEPRKKKRAGPRERVTDSVMACPCATEQRKGWGNDGY